MRRWQWRRFATGVAVIASLAGATVSCTSGSGGDTTSPRSVRQPPVYSGPSGGVTPSAVHPNVVFVLTDDLSSELLQYMPHVLDLERRGTSFSNYIVSDSLCCPSRSSIFTGEFPHNTGVYTNSGSDGGFVKFNADGNERRTFAPVLQAAGYRTAFMGKYLNGYEEPLSPKAKWGYVPPGWNEWDGIGGGYREYGFTANENHQLVHYPKAPRYYLTTVLQHRAQDFMRTSMRQHAAYFLEVATFTPHVPYVPALRDVGTARGVRAPRWPNFNKKPLHAPGWMTKTTHIDPSGIKAIDATQRLRVEDVRSIDRLVGALEQTAASMGQLRNTVFVFSSDNGYHVGSHSMRAGKLTAFDTDIRVPLVVAGPGVSVGKVQDAITQNVDLAPTFDEWAGAPVPPTTDGHSLVPLLHDQLVPWRAAALVEHHGPVQDPHDPDVQTFQSGNPTSYEALRTQKFTFVHYSDGENEYYDLTRDPWELDNIAATLSPSYLRLLNAWVVELSHCKAAGCWRAAAAPPTG